MCNQKGGPTPYRHDSNLNPETRRIKNRVEIYVVKEPFLIVRVGRCYRNWHFVLFWVDFSIHLRSLASSDFLVHYSNDSIDVKRQSLDFDAGNTLRKEGIAVTGL